MNCLSCGKDEAKYGRKLFTIKEGLASFKYDAITCEHCQAERPKSDLEFARTYLVAIQDEKIKITGSLWRPYFQKKKLRELVHQQRLAEDRIKRISKA